MEENKMEGENNNKGEEEMLPGFRFHPTDEELVGFYLKRKIQQQPLSIELIKQLDIYKFDPWDLPKFATGEKEWYFYCPRDRKYRNSARPNRVTGAGFWKATGTDRPIYSSEGTKCIGLKKSLVFYKGRAAKGVKTDWMMHEFRLPSLGDSLPSKKCLDRNLPANDAWAICRIFKKTSPITPRTQSNSWISPSLPKSDPCTPILHGGNTSKTNTTHLSPQSILDTATSSPMQSNSGNMYEMNNILQSPNSFSFLDIPSCNTSMDNQFLNIPTMLDLPPSYILPQLEPSEQPKSEIDIPSMLMNMSSMHGNFSMNNRECNVDYHDLPPDLATLLSQDYMQHANVGNNHQFDENNEVNYEDIHNALMGNLSSTILPLHNEEEQHQCGDISNVGSFPVFGLPEPWKSSASLIWDCSPLS